MILNICRLLQRKKTSIPTVGQWYTTPAGHVLRVSLVDRECQKVICEPLEWGPVIPEGKVEITISKYEKTAGAAA
ncbi:hypothetical protein EWR95_07940 [Escherichia coli]|nr:hypothetical protein [Escherichia coli]MBF8823777.1 hypothetical protein [Escherichia coli]